MRPVVISGTDTGVGKTWIGEALARRLRASGRRVCALKLIESGVDLLEPGDEDGVRLARAAGQGAPERALVRLGAPVAPPEAADRDGVALNLGPLLEAARDYAAVADVTLVEGAGGVLAPLTWEATALDVARALGAPVLLVSADRLGTINHTLLSVRAIEAAGVGLAGVVLNGVSAADASTGSNLAALRRLTGGIRLAAVPWAAPDEAVDPILEWL